MTDEMEECTKAAEQGEAPAQYLLGAMYRFGKGVPQDYAKAYMWLNLVAAAGSEGALTLRDSVLENMTPEQIAEAQKLSSEWVEKHSKK